MSPIATPPTTCVPQPTSRLTRLGLAPWLPAAASAGLALLLYAVTLGGTYIYDDVAILKMDKRLPDPHLWGKYWTDSYNDGVDNLYRPLVSMSYALQWWLHGDRAWAFHAVNLLLHAAVCAALAEFVRRRIGAAAALTAGLIFAALPIHVEDVANVVGRAELMCALGTIGALLLLTRPLTTWRALAIAGCFVVALLSKEQGMLLPALLLIFALARRRFDPPATPTAVNRQPTLLLVCLLCWLLGGYIVWREKILKFWWDRDFLDWTINPMVASRWNPHGGSVGADAWRMPLALLGRYTALIFWPVKLSPDYGATVIGWHVRDGDPYFYLGVAAALVGAAVLVLCLRKRSPLGLLAILGLGLSYGMVGNFVSLIGTNFAERLMYLPTLFLALLLGVAATRLPHRALWLALPILVAGASVRTFLYAQRWNDKLAFYRTSLQDQPNSIRLYMLLGSEYSARGQLKDADRAVKAGRALLPEYWGIWEHCGAVAMDRGAWDEAQADFNRAMEIHPSPRTAGWLQELQRRQPATLPATDETASEPARQPDTARPAAPAGLSPAASSQPLDADQPAAP